MSNDSNDIKPKTKRSSKSEDNKIVPTHRMPVSGYTIVAGISFLVSFLLVYYYLRHIQGKVTDVVDQRIFYSILIGISISALVFGVMNAGSRQV